MKRYLAVAVIFASGCQTQLEGPAPRRQTPQEAPAPRPHALPEGHVRLLVTGVIAGEDPEQPLSAAATRKAWSKAVVHVHCAPGTSYQALLEHVIGPAVDAKSTSLVLHASREGPKTRLDLAYVPASMHVTFATLAVERGRLRLEGKTHTEDDACLRAIRALRSSWRGEGRLAIQLRVPRAQQALPLEDLQRAAALVVEGGCRPVLSADDSAYQLERKRFEHAMAAEGLDERLRLLRAHVKAYPKPPWVSVAYSPFAWEWEGELYVGDEWNEWKHVRTGNTIHAETLRQREQDKQGN
jgi:hypothetical protein